jgi:hypothetical protein
MFDLYRFAAEFCTALPSTGAGTKQFERRWWPAAECSEWDPEMLAEHPYNAAKATRDGGVP